MSKIERETDFFEEDDLATNPAQEYQFVYA